MKYDFYRHYQGPRGNHLSQLTKYTLSKQKRSPEQSLSIHPAKSRAGKSRMEKDAQDATA